MPKLSAPAVARPAKVGGKYCERIDAHGGFDLTLASLTSRHRFAFARQGFHFFLTVHVVPSDQRENLNRAEILNQVQTH